jgi:hypothetical protein
VTYQRGRILPCREPYASHCAANGEQILHGKYCWIEGKADDEYLRANGFDIRAEFIELLPEFAEDVPLISWEQFVQECRQ